MQILTAAAAVVTDEALFCRDPLKKAPEQMPGNQPARRGDEQTQPQPGETSASAALGQDEEEYDEEDGATSAE